MHERVRFRIVDKLTSRNSFIGIYASNHAFHCCPPLKNKFCFTLPFQISANLKPKGLLWVRKLYREGGGFSCAIQQNWMLKTSVNVKQKKKTLITLLV